MATVNIVGTCTIRSSASANYVGLATGALYGEVTYGSAVYGNPLGGASTLPTYSARPLTAQATNYTTVELSWALPNAGYQLALVRNCYSVPAHHSDGIVLAQFSYTAVPYFVDTLTTSSGGMWLYYSLFMLTSANGGFWQRAGDCQVMLPTNWGYGARMYSLLPPYYQTLDDAMDDPIYVLPQSAPTWQSLEGLTWARLTGVNQ